MSKNFYVTFGSDKEFPYQNGFLTINAENERQANEYFQALHPNRAGSNCLNYSFMYTEEEWKNIYPKYYEGTSPHETITADMVKERLESKSITEQNRGDNR